MFPLCDFAIDETRKTSPSCLSCSAHTDGNGTPKRIMVRKQNNHLQTKMWSDMTAQRWFPGYAPCVHNKPILDNALFFSNSWLEPPSLFSLDYNWLCPSINLPRLSTTTRFITDISTKLQLGQCVCLSYIFWWQHRQWQHCEMVVILLPGNGSLTYSEIYCYSKLAFSLHLFWFCSSKNAEIHLNGISDRNRGKDTDTSEQINKSNEYLYTHQC